MIVQEIKIINNPIQGDFLHQINYLINTSNISQNSNIGILPGYIPNDLFFGYSYIPYKNLELGNLVYYNYATTYSSFLNQIVVLSLPILINNGKYFYYNENNQLVEIDKKEKENIIFGIIIGKHNANENLYSIFKIKYISHYSFGLNLANLNEKKYDGIIDLQKNSIVNGILDFAIYNKIYLYNSKNNYAKFILADNSFLNDNDGIFIGNAILIDEFRLSCLFEIINRLWTKKSN